MLICFAFLVSLRRIKTRVYTEIITTLFFPLYKTLFVIDLNFIKN